MKKEGEAITTSPSLDYGLCLKGLSDNHFFAVYNV